MPVVAFPGAIDLEPLCAMASSLLVVIPPAWPCRKYFNYQPLHKMSGTICKHFGHQKIICQPPETCGATYSSGSRGSQLVAVYHVSQFELHHCMLLCSYSHSEVIVDWYHRSRYFQYAQSYFPWYYRFILPIQLSMYQVTILTLLETHSKVQCS
jgi:hypothetical protein